MAEQTSKADRVKLNRELAQMLKGGVIMDVTTPEQARIAEEAGACAVMALERIPADIRAAGGVSRMSDPKMIKGIQNAVSIPVIASGGAGKLSDFADAFLETGCSAALAASLFHFRELTVQEVKADCRAKGIPMR